MRKGAFTEIAFLISLQRASVILVNGAIRSVIAVTDPKLRHFETEPLPNAICKTALLLLVNKMMTSLIVQSQANQIKTIER